DCTCISSKYLCKFFHFLAFTKKQFKFIVVFCCPRQICLLMCFSDFFYRICFAVSLLWLFEFFEFCQRLFKHFNKVFQCSSKIISLWCSKPEAVFLLSEIFRYKSPFSLFLMSKK